MEPASPIFTDPQAIRAARELLRARGARLALTNGVFDLLHVGHLRYLRAAAARADSLWVGLNSDRSVRALKGPSRPLVPWPERAELLAALRPVGAVVFFDEATADALLHLVEPELYIKGGDYTEATLPEAPTARALGAEIHLLPFSEGHSTTRLVERIRGGELGGTRRNL